MAFSTPNPPAEAAGGRCPQSPSPLGRFSQEKCIFRDSEGQQPSCPMGWGCVGMLAGAFAAASCSQAGHISADCWRTWGCHPQDPTFATREQSCLVPCIINSLQLGPGTSTVLRDTSNQGSAAAQPTRGSCPGAELLLDELNVPQNHSFPGLDRPGASLSLPIQMRGCRKMVFTCFISSSKSVKNKINASRHFTGCRWTFCWFIYFAKCHL